MAYYSHPIACSREQTIALAANIKNANKNKIETTGVHAKAFDVNLLH